MSADGDGAAWQGMIGHVRHGESWSFWTELAPVNRSVPQGLHPGIPGSSLGIDRWSSLTPYCVQGVEWRMGGVTLAAEVGLPQAEGNSRAVLPELSPSWKGTLSFPSAAADPGSNGVRRQNLPSRWWPPLVPWSPFVSYMQSPGWYGETAGSWWSFGVTAPIFNFRRNH